MNDKRRPSNWIVDFSVSQPVLANLTFVILMIIGVAAFLGLPRDINPDVSFETALIITPYPGATPEDVEKLVTIPIEDEIRDVKDVSRVYSYSEENLSTIVVEFETGAPIKERVRDLRDEVDKVAGLPEDAKDSQVMELDTSGWPMLSIIFSSETLPERRLKEIVEDIQDDLENIPGVASVDLSGVRERQIWVNVDRSRLERYKLSLSQVADAITLANRDVPAGTISVGQQEALVRTMGEYQNIQGISGTIIRSYRPGDAVRIRDIAVVEDTFEEPTTYSRLDGQPAISVLILKEKDADAHTVVRAAKAMVDQKMAVLAYPPKVSYINDMTILIDQSLKVLWNNALIGLTLVVLTLLVFVGSRNAIMAGFGIPFSFLATFTFMRWTGMTINGITIFALVLVLGIVVDDAIVIIENIYRYLEKGLKPVEAARYGGEVAAPVISSVTTTMAAFLPMMFMVGIVGKFLAVIPKVVIVALGASLLESLFILPSHMADFGKPMKRPPLGEPIFRLLLKIYRRLIVVVLRNRALVLSTVLALAVVGVLLIPYLGIDMFPAEEFAQFSVRLEAPEGTSLDEMDQIVSRVEKVAMTLPEDELDAVLSRVGVILGEYGVTRGANVGEIMVDVVEKEDRDRSVDEIIDDLRGRIGTIPGIRSLDFYELEGGPPVGRPIAVQIKGKTLEGVDPLVDEVKLLLGNIPGVKDITVDLKPGKDLVTLRVDPERAAQYGLSAALIGREIRAANDGLAASVFRDGDEEVDIVVKLSRADRDSIRALGSLSMNTPSGQLVPLRNMVDIARVPGPARIIRRDFERTVTIGADLDSEVNTSVKANQTFAASIPILLARYPNFKIEQGGEYEKTQESFASLGQAFLIALLIIYMILGIQFKSFFQPLIIMLTVPFAFIGVVAGLMINGLPFSIVAFVAVVALSGIVVNDSLILVDFVNKKRESGAPLYLSVVRSGMVRMRPVMMTSLTTIFGLLPMALALGGESVTWEPLAQSIIWGLGFSTFLTLFIIPIAYTYLAQWTRRWNLERFKAGD